MLSSSLPKAPSPSEHAVEFPFYSECHAPFISGPPSVSDKGEVAHYKIRFLKVCPSVSDTGTLNVLYIEHTFPALHGLSNICSWHCKVSYCHNRQAIHYAVSAWPPCSHGGPISVFSISCQMTCSLIMSWAVTLRTGATELLMSTCVNQSSAPSFPAAQHLSGGGH